MAQKRKTLFYFGFTAKDFKSTVRTEPVGTTSWNNQNVVANGASTPPFDLACADMMQKLSDYDKAECYKNFSWGWNLSYPYQSADAALNMAVKCL